MMFISALIYIFDITVNQKEIIESKSLKLKKSLNKLLNNLFDVMPQYSAREISHPPINKTTGEKIINKICKKKNVFTAKIQHLNLKSPKKRQNTTRRKFNLKKIIFFCNCKAIGTLN